MLRTAYAHRATAINDCQHFAMKTRTELSKFLSFVLRHEPGAIGLTLDSAGWAAVEELLAKCGAHGKAITRELLNDIVSTSAKQRFAFSADGTRIRASQGHSIDVELGYAPSPPPAQLFHGTNALVLPAIRAEGLRKMERHHVHLSPDAATARLVAARRGAPIILTIDSARMHADGHTFFVSANGVWLTESVPPDYIVFPDHV
jgi:putative RNA 2'-phosphotransferase